MSERKAWVRYYQEVLRLSDEEADGLRFTESPRGPEVLVVAHQGHSLDSFLVGDRGPGEVVAAVSDYLEALTIPIPRRDILGGRGLKAVEVWREYIRELRNKAAGRD